MMMADLEPANIAAAIEAKKSGKVKAPNELDMKKEERLQMKEARLAARFSTNNTPQASSSSAVAPEPVDPSYLLDKIAAYKERFPDLKSRNAKLSAKSSVEELQDELHYLELQLGSSKDNNMGSMLFVSGMGILENVTKSYNPLKLQLDGLGNVAKDNIEQFTPIIDELMIKYGASFYMAPEYRLVLAAGMLVYTVHSANSGDARVGEMLGKMHAKAQVPAGFEHM